MTSALRSPSRGTTVPGQHRGRDRHRQRRHRRHRLSHQHGRGRRELSVTWPSQGGTIVLDVVATSPRGRHRPRPSARGLRRHSRARCCSTYRPGRRRQRARQLRLPDLAQLQAGGLRPAALPGLDDGTDVIFRLQTRDLTPDLRQPPRGPAGRHLCPRPGRRQHLDGRVLPAAQLPDRRRVGLEPADRGPGLRPALRRPVRSHPRHRHHPGNESHGSSPSASPSRRLGQPGPGLGLHRGADRPGRVQPRPGPRLHPTPQDFQFGVCATGPTDPLCTVDPTTVPKAIDV